MGVLPEDNQKIRNGTWPRRMGGKTLSVNTNDRGEIDDFLPTHNREPPLPPNKPVSRERVWEQQLSVHVHAQDDSSPVFVKEEKPGKCQDIKLRNYMFTGPNDL